MRIVDFLKDYQMNKLINFIREHEPISRIELSKRLGIPQPTVTRMTEKLIQEQLIIESGFGTASGGRRPVLLSINSSRFYSIGVEIGRSTIKMAITDLSGNLIISQTKETNNKGRIIDLIDFIKISIDRMLVVEGIEESELLGIGIGIPGPINESEDGLITIPNYYDVLKVPLRKMLQQAFTLPVTIDVNANVAALAEKWFGSGLRCNNFVYVMADAGIGSGIIINGELYRGSNRETGYIGHSTIEMFGERCSCGNYGCLEAYVSTTNIIRHVQKLLEENPVEKQRYFEKNIEDLTFEDVVHSLKCGAPTTTEVVQIAGKYLGTGIANIISLLDPEIIVVGGRLRQLGKPFIDTVRTVVQSRVLGFCGKGTPIIVSELNDGVVLGAAALVIQETFSIEKSFYFV